MTNPLTADVNEQIFLDAGKEYRVDISGNLGGGVFSLQYVDAVGTKRALDGTALTINTSVVFVAPSAPFYLVLTGSTTPNLFFNFTKLT